MEKPRPTVIHIISSSGFYGAENVVANLAEHMSNVETIIVCICKDPKNVKDFQNKVASLEHCQFITVPTDFSSAWIKISQLITEVENPVLHSHGYKEVVLALLLKTRFQLLSSRIKRVPPVLNTQHGFVHNSGKSHVYNRLGIWACRSPWVAKTYCVTNAIKEIYLKNGINPDKLQLLPNAIAEAPNYSSRREAGAPILFVGRFSKEKNPELFIRAFHRLRNLQPNLTGTMLGEGPLFAQMQQLVKQLGLESVLTLKGFQQNAREEIQSARLVAITSTTEGIPLVALEAMSMGTPVVATAVGGIPELISNESDGLLVKGLNPETFAQTCNKALEHTELYTTLQSNARETINTHHNITKQAQQILKDYTRLLPKKSGNSVGAAL